MKTTEHRHNHQPQPTTHQGAAAVQSPQGEQIAQLEAAIAASSAMATQRKLAGIMHDSPRQAAQAKLFDSIHNSPRQAAQAQAFAAIHGGPAQTAQRQKLESLFHRLAQREAEELLPAQPETAQRKEAKPNHTGLPDNLKSGIETLSGLSMDSVRVHYNSSQPAQLNAHAYAQGTEIHVAPGQEKHLPHEAWHVVQQAQGRVQPTMQMKGGTPVNDDAGLEQEADVMGARAAQMRGFKSTSPQENALALSAFETIQRATEPGLTRGVQVIVTKNNDQRFKQVGKIFKETSTGYEVRFGPTFITYPHDALEKAVVSEIGKV